MVMRKKFLILRIMVLLFLFLTLYCNLGLGFGNSQTALAQTTIEEARKSIVRIRVVARGTNPVNARARGNIIRDGSGFVVGSNPPFQYIATSWNIVKYVDSDIYVWLSADDFVPCYIYVSLQESNIALLRLDPNHWLYPYEPLRIGDRSQIAIGDEIYALGFPRDSLSARYSDVSVVKSVFSRARGLNYILEDRVRINSDVEGGPLLNKNGVVVGITIRDVPGVAAGTSGGVDVLALVEVLEARGIDYLKPGDDPSLSGLPPLKQVESPRVSDKGVLSWKRVPDAKEYKINLFLDDKLVHTHIADAETTSYDLEDLIDEYGSGTYTAQVTAIGGEDYSDGLPSPSSNEFIEDDESVITPLIIGLGAVVVLLIILLIFLTTKGSKKKSSAKAPSPPAPRMAGSTPATQKITPPATQPKKEPVDVMKTQAKPSVKSIGIKGISGHFAGQSIELVDNQLVIGRDPRLAQLVYPQSQEDISRKHLTIRFDEKSNKFVLEDSSVNGTFLSSNQKLDSGKPYYLNSGERFYIADPKEVFELRIGLT